MIFITGDIHGSYDIHKFSTSVFSKQKELSRSDYMIICGGFWLSLEQFRRGTLLAEMAGQ